MTTRPNSRGASAIEFTRNLLMHAENTQLPRFCREINENAGSSFNTMKNVSRDGRDKEIWNDAKKYSVLK